MTDKKTKKKKYCKHDWYHVVKQPWDWKDWEDYYVCRKCGSDDYRGSKSVTEARGLTDVL